MPWTGALLGTATEVTQTTYKFISLEGPYWVATPAPGYLLFSDVVEKNAAGALIYKYDPATNMSLTYLPGGALKSGDVAGAIKGTGCCEHQPHFLKHDRRHEAPDLILGDPRAP